MELLNNAKSIVEQECNKNQIKEIKEYLIDSVTKENKSLFVLNFSEYFIRLAIILQKCFRNENNKILNYSYKNSCEYICLNILSNKDLYESLVSLNKEINKVKFTLLEIECSINSILKTFELIILEVIEVTKVKEFELFKL